MRLKLYFFTAFLFFIFPAYAAEKIDINTASSENLIKIIHIGEIRAQELISLRPFYSLDDLIRIKGIGEKKLEDIKKQGLACVEPLLRPKTESEQQIPYLEIPISGEENETQLEPGLIDINNAPIETLQKIAGIGPVLAQRIIDERPFYSLNDLLNVKGIGEMTLQKIKEQGLAWVEEKEIKNEPSEKLAAKISNTVENKKNRIESPVSVFLVAMAVAIFSSFILMVLKLRQKNNFYT